MVPTPLATLVRRLTLPFLLLLLAAPAPAKTSADTEIFQRAEKILKGKGDFVHREVERVGNKTIVVEAFASLSADYKVLPNILSDIGGYPDWIFEGINQKPGGGTYIVKIQGTESDPTDPSILIMHLLIDLPIYKKELTRRFKFETETKKDVFTLNGRVIPEQEGVIASASGYLKVFPVPGNRAWLYANASVRLNPWLLYEALPKRLLQKEAGHRIQIVLDNYLEEENRYKQQAASLPVKRNLARNGVGTGTSGTEGRSKPASPDGKAKSSRSPKGKKAERGMAAEPPAQTPGSADLRRE